jgi:hypothetical protein
MVFMDKVLSEVSDGNSATPLPMQPLIDGIQGGSWAIILSLLVFGYLSRGKIEAFADAMVKTMLTINDTVEQNKHTSEKIAKELKTIRSLHSAEARMMRELERLLRSQTAAIEKVMKLIEERDDG